ncbi:hypothetical protein K439DRAFT_1660680 [Ramaria rubella]|nr:hypothetical protein K439DRAFT_1660680 [Ramaria rubella]
MANNLVDYVAVPDPAAQEAVRDNLNARTSSQKIHFDPKTHEPYLPFPSSCKVANLRLTPARASDAPSYMDLLNDPTVYPRLFGPPYPFPLARAEGWTRGSQKRSQEVFHAWTAGEWSKTALNPFNCIRRVLDGEPDIFVGELPLHEVKKEDGTHFWDMGVVIIPIFQKQGVGAIAIELLLKSWIIPHMTCHKIRAESFQSNPASSAVFIKAGFAKELSLCGRTVEQPDSKGGTKELDITVEWRRDV